MIQVMENIFEDAVKNNVAEDGSIREDVLMNTVKASVAVVVGLIKDAAVKMPDTKFAMITPITRPSLEWYTLRFSEITLIFEEAVVAANVANIKFIKCFAVESQVFEDDMLHLTQESGEIFVESILRASEVFFAEENQEIETEMEVEQVTIKSKPVKKTKSVIIVPQPGAGDSDKGSEKSRITDLERRMKSIEEKCESDNLIFARDREDLDYITNERKEDRLIITGLSNVTPMPADAGEKKLWYDKMVSEALCKIDPEGSGRILLIKPGWNDGRSIPMVEVRMENKEMARRIRSRYAEKRKNKEDLGNLFVANCVTLATRVRTDILRAIATKNSKKGSLELYVAPFSSRPVLHVKDISKSPYALTFADAIKRYGASLEEEDLGEAYRRAGRSFDRQLSQIFVVLKEDPNRLRIMSTRGRGSGRPYGNRGRGQERGGQQGRGGYSRGGLGSGHQIRGQKRGFEDQNSNSGQSSSKKQAARGYSAAK